MPFRGFSGNGPGVDEERRDRLEIEGVMAVPGPRRGRLCKVLQHPGRPVPAYSEGGGPQVTTRLSSRTDCLAIEHIAIDYQTSYATPAMSSDPRSTAV
jgi:hypothetical protein